jgi:hypothetical protein
MMAWSSFTTDRKEYPTDYFSAPVKTTIRLSGTFGELRSNHFHSGIDIKGYIGLPLYCIADGYIDRIKVQAAGYGKVLYINHPNGYTSVYAHMNEFTPEIEAYVKQQQYEQQQFEVDLSPPTDSFTFLKGELLGEMGTTGYSFGPHLHFEVRDTKSEKPLNPLLFGFKVEDTQAPRMHQLKIYQLNEKTETKHAFTKSLVLKNGKYALRDDTLEVSDNRIGLGLKVYDHMNGVSNWNGIYTLETYVDDSLMHRFTMESFGFDESRYLNAHLDYEEQTQKKSYFNRCYLLPGNQLSIYTGSDGVVSLAEKRKVKIRMLATDVAGNRTALQFWLKRSDKQLALKSPPIFNYVLPYNEESIIDNYPLFLHFPKGTFYENLYLKYHTSQERSADVYSTVHSIHQATTPVHRFFKIGIQSKSIPDSLRSKAFIAYCSEGQDIVNCGGKWSGDTLITRSRTLGDYCIMLDQIPPEVTPISFKYDMSRSNRMSFVIKDNLATGGSAQGLRYRATIDGKWILMEYDYKKDLLVHRFDGYINSGKHQLRLEVTDDRNNTQVFERTFVK